jgi:serine/threonine protein kinase
MCILAAVFVEDVVVQELTDFIWIGGHPYNDNKLKFVTRMLSAVGNGITELEDFYSKLSHNPLPDSQRFFPFIRQFPVGDCTIRFSYTAYLSGSSPESHSKAIFFAKTEPEEGRGGSCREVVVKFVQRYNAKAHRLLAAERLAPGLLYCSKEDDNFPELGGLIMVVMAYIDGKTAHDRFGSNPLPRLILNQVQKAIDILHNNNLVFADLRPPNIMVTHNEQAMLVDFDWCGVHGEDTYPVTLNDDSGSINWHPGVRRGGTMYMEHDLFRLQCM